MQSQNTPVLTLPTVKQRMAAIICAAALAASTMVAPGAAFADLPEGQTGSGETDLVVKIDNSERGGTEQPKVLPAPVGTDTGDLVDENGDPDPTGAYILNPYYNPDVEPAPDGDGLGDNLAFTVPTAINYVAKANGEMMAPATYIENHSVMQAHVSSLDVDANSADGWNIVADAASDTTHTNAVDFQIGPDSTEQLAGSDYLDKTAVSAHATDITKWNMASHNATDTDKVALVTAGHMNNVAKNIAAAGDKFGEIHWYVTPGNLSA